MRGDILMSMLDFLFLLAILFGLFSGYARGLVGSVARIAAYLASERRIPET